MKDLLVGSAGMSGCGGLNQPLIRTQQQRGWLICLPSDRISELQVHFVRSP
ncbi:MAG: hypothetical protein AAGH78_03860 [Cyanobacteria bacterium P01_H01_bin.58]